MAEPSLTEFQAEAEHRLRALLADLGRSDVRSELYAGIVPFESSEEQAAVKIASGDLQVWIFFYVIVFEDSNGGDVFEIYDYPNGGALLNEVSGKLRERLAE